MTKKTEQGLTWTDVYWAWKMKGYPPEEAAHQADEFIRRREKERRTPVKRKAAQ